MHRSWAFGRKGLMAAPRPPCAWQHTGNPQLMNSPGGKGWIGREKPHNIGFASIFDNNRVFGCTKDTGSMSVCIHIKGFDGIWWQGKTMFCIQNKRNPCFRWQRLAVLCIHFSINKESGCKEQESKARSCIPKHREQGFWWHDWCEPHLLDKNLYIPPSLVSPTFGGHIRLSTRR